MKITDITVDSTNRSIDKYIKGRMNPDIVLNHLEKFTSLVKEKGKILDIGCGHGRDCKYFEDKGFKVTGIDLSEEMLKVSNEICNNTKLIKMDFRNIGKQSWKFDGIWACASLYHLRKKELVDILEDIHKILNKGAIIFIAIKKGNTQGFIYKEDLNVYKYYSLYEIEEIKGIMENKGFRIVDLIIEEKKDTWINIYAMEDRNGRA